MIHGLQSMLHFPETSLQLLSYYIFPGYFLLGFVSEFCILSFYILEFYFEFVILDDFVCQLLLQLLYLIFLLLAVLILHLPFKFLNQLVLELNNFVGCFNILSQLVAVGHNFLGGLLGLNQLVLVLGPKFLDQLLSILFIRMLFIYFLCELASQVFVLALEFFDLLQHLLLLLIALCRQRILNLLVQVVDLVLKQLQLILEVVLLLPLLLDLSFVLVALFKQQQVLRLIHFHFVL